MTSLQKGHHTKNVSQPGWREGPRSAQLSLNGSASGAQTPERRASRGSCSPGSRGPPALTPAASSHRALRAAPGPPRCGRERAGCGGGGRRCCCCCWRCGAGSRGERERSARQRTQVGRGARAAHLPIAPGRAVTALSSSFRERDGLRSPFVWVSWGIFYTAGEKGWRNRYLFPNYTLHVFGRVHRVRWLLPSVSRDHHGM